MTDIQASGEVSERGSWKGRCWEEGGGGMGGSSE